MLMLDRYLAANGRALDLATGAPIRWHLRRFRTPKCRHDAPLPPLFSARGRSRLIDFDLRKASRLEVWERAAPAIGELHDGPLQLFRAALADARDGQPRALDLIESSAERWALLQRALAREARLSGFVPLDADVLGAVLAEARWRWPPWLKDRSLVIFATNSTLSCPAAWAMFRLATRDARPHLVVRGATTELLRPRLIAAAMPIHEGTPDEAPLETSTTLVERAESLLEAGRLVDAEASARWSLLLSEPEEQVAARCTLARTLVSQRRLLEARAAVAPVSTSEGDAIRVHIRRSAADTRVEPPLVDAFLEILRLCQEIDDPSVALTRIATRLHAALAASVVALVIPDRGQPVVVAHAGAFVPSASHLGLASRALDTGVAWPAGSRTQADEAAWPIRYGATTVGALWCRWSIGTPLMAQDASAMLGLAATAVAPAIHELGERLQRPQVTAALMPDLVGGSAAMEVVRQAVVKAAASPFPVLIEGESGAGKELVARAVHASSIRRARRFCALNCAALADDLVEAELFGHTRGAFTGAVAERAGLFEEAQGGTLFLDEVAELGARVQAKLLRTLQESEIRRVGESTTRKVDARIVAATNRSLASEAVAGRFRNDLRYRLDVLRISIPPLRDRLEDLPPLVRHLWAVLAKRTGSRAVLSPSAMSLLGAYDWPGNVRELQNVLASVMVAGPQRGVIGPHGLPNHFTRASATTARTTLAAARREFEERYVRAALARAGGRVIVAARELGVSRQGLTKLAARLGLGH